MADDSTVGDALVRYINQGITLGSVNMPEAQLRSLTLDEPNHARVTQRLCHQDFMRVAYQSQVIYIHRNVPGVLRRGML